jgi:hypothetical protein
MDENSVFQARWILLPMAGLFVCMTAIGVWAG